MERVALLFSFELPFAFEGQHALREAHFDLFLVDVRQIRRDHICRLGLLDVHGRRPVPERQGVRLRPGEAVQAPFHFCQLTEWIPSDDVHNVPPSSAPS